MGKYLITWEMDTTKIPVSPKERAELWSPMVDMIGDAIKRGITKDWGAFVGELRGYGVAEGTEEEISNLLHEWVPFVHFTTHPILSLDGMAGVIKHLAK